MVSIWLDNHLGNSSWQGFLYEFRNPARVCVITFPYPVPSGLEHSTAYGPHAKWFWRIKKLHKQRCPPLYSFWPWRAKLQISMKHQRHCPHPHSAKSRRRINMNSKSPWRRKISIWLTFIVWLNIPRFSIWPYSWRRYDRKLQGYIPYKRWKRVYNPTCKCKRCSSGNLLGLLVFHAARRLKNQDYSVKIYTAFAKFNVRTTNIVREILVYLSQFCSLWQFIKIL